MDKMGHAERSFDIELERSSYRLWQNAFEPKWYTLSFSGTVLAEVVIYQFEEWWIDVLTFCKIEQMWKTWWFEYLFLKLN